METITDRINLVVQNLGISKNEFGKKIGVSSSLISQITTKKNNFRADIIQKISYAYPQLNIYWMLNGIGDMWIENHNYKPQEQPQQSKKRNSNYHDKISEINTIENPVIDDNKGNILQVVKFWGLVLDKDKDLERTINALNELESLKMDLTEFISRLNSIPNDIHKEAQLVENKILMSDKFIDDAVKRLIPLKKYYNDIDSLNSFINSVLLFVEKDSEL